MRGYVLFSVATLAAIGSGCDSSPTVPTASTETPALSLSVTPLKVDESETFVARFTGTSGIDATWMSANPDVCRITPAGRATGVRPGEAVVSATDGVRSAVTSIRVVPDVAGKWTGEATTISQWIVSGYTRLPPPCEVLTGQPCPPFSYELATHQVHDQVTLLYGQRFEEGSGTLGIAPLIMTGAIDVDGRVTTTLTPPAKLGSVQLDSSTWTVQFDAAAGVLSGERTDLYSQRNAFGPVVTGARYRLNLQRRP
jgi:Bacterial Ig-like domain (group 2)